MRVAKHFRGEQELVEQFIDILGKGSTTLMGSKHANAGFFMFAHQFIQGYVQPVLFKKEELLLKTLEEIGFNPDDGPVGAMYADYRHCQETAEQLLNAARSWHAGDEEARAEVGWASSNYTSALRQHINRLKNLIFPLMEQNVSQEDEHRFSEKLNNFAFENSAQSDPAKFLQLLNSLKDELDDWG
jgi:hemerythrin-like domain-containing protein